MKICLLEIFPLKNEIFSGDFSYENLFIGDFSLENLRFFFVEDLFIRVFSLKIWDIFLNIYPGHLSSENLKIF